MSQKSIWDYKKSGNVVTFGHVTNPKDVFNPIENEYNGVVKSDQSVQRDHFDTFKLLDLPVIAPCYFCISARRCDYSVNDTNFCCCNCFQLNIGKEGFKYDAEYD